jgi:hypothetical protein
MHQCAGILVERLDVRGREALGGVRPEERVLRACRGTGKGAEQEREQCGGVSLHVVLLKWDGRSITSGCDYRLVGSIASAEAPMAPSPLR